jgi:glutathione S-transferase
MAAGSDKFVLRSTTTSPFGRKVRMAAEVLGLMPRIVVMPADTLDDNDTLRTQNPLGKLPCLLFADGSVLYDSRVIVEFLQETAGTDRLLPRLGMARYRMLTQAALADGITEAGLLIVYEGRFREAAAHSPRWLAHQQGKIARALAAFEVAPPDPAVTDIVSIGLCCALGYLDWRRPVEWRQSHPRLATWLVAFTQHEPAVAQTRAEAA